MLFAIDSNRRVLFYNLNTGYVEKQLRAESLADNPIRVAYTLDGNRIVVSVRIPLFVVERIELRRHAHETKE